LTLWEREKCLVEGRKARASGKEKEREREIVGGEEQWKPLPSTTAHEVV
jgi:hypothetical protein